MKGYPILYTQPERSERIYGVSLPVFIHNGSYHLSDLDVYKDGVADCWELITLDDVQGKVDEGWVSTTPPTGSKFSIIELGYGKIERAEWLIPSSEIAEQVRATFHQLNPTRTHLLDLAKRREDIARRDHEDPDDIWLSRFHSETQVIRRSGEGGEIAGAEVRVFDLRGKEPVITWCFVFADRLARIGLDGDLIPVQSIKEMLADGRLGTSPKRRRWITLEGLGRFLPREANWHIDPLERWREIENLIGILNGATDVVEVCHQAYLAYQADPSEANRDHLRTTYEAVPEHQRIYTCRSMDNKDRPIRRILYG